MEKPRPLLQASSNDVLSQVVEDALCRKCQTPLKLSALRCPNCSTRHAMGECSCCGGALFKHASTQVIRESWQAFPPTGNLVSRLWTWFRAPRQQETHYLHRACVAHSADLIKGATAVFDPDESCWHRPVQDACHSASPKDDTPHEVQSDLGNEPLIPAQVVKESLQVSPSQTSHADADDLFQSLFLEDSPGRADLCHPYQLGQRDFFGAQLQGLSIEHQCLKNINLSQADLKRTAWNSVDLSAVDLSDALADYASFINTQLVGGQFRNISLRDGKVILSDLAQSDFYKADLRRTDFYSSSWQHSTLTLANLTESRLDAVDLSLSCLVLARLTRASLMEANLARTNCEQADFSSANMSWASFKEAQLARAKLSDAVLQCADLSGADLSDAILLGTDFLSSNIEQVSTLQGAIYNDLTRFPFGFDPEARGMVKQATQARRKGDSPYLKACG